MAVARTALDEARATLEELHAGCCDPDRSPRMLEIEEVLDSARAHLEEIPERAQPLFERLEDAGARVGRLQVICCTPVRIPLYARMLEKLTEIQLQVSKAMGTGY